jgi:hypothetical protein
MFRTAFLIGCSLLSLAPPVRAQDSAMESFEEVDPYTGGDRELMAKLGYVSYGPFSWRGPQTTTGLRQTIGDPPVLWVETEHFRIGSTLGSYRLVGDREEKARIKAEIARLKAKLGKLKAPRKSLDPWLRLHLYAQRCEDLAQAFEADFGLESSDYAEVGPNLGQSHKFLVLLCERNSELGRCIKDAWGAEAAVAWRYGWGVTEGMFYGASYEAIAASWKDAGGDVPFDSILHARLVAGVTSNLVDGYRTNKHGVPRWLTYGLSYVYGRRIDPRWVTYVGQKTGSTRKDEWKWEPRVANLVKNQFYASTEDMFGWKGPEDMNVRDHLVLWSKMEYLLDREGGDRAGFLRAMCVEGMGTDSVELQRSALKTYLGLTPAELDEGWARWVKKTYSKR